MSMSTERLLQAVKNLSVQWEDAPWSEEFGACEFCSAQSLVIPSEPHRSDCAWVELQAAIKEVEDEC